MHCVYIICLLAISISELSLFQRSTCSHVFEWYHHYFGRLPALIQFSQWYSVSFKQALAVIPFFKGAQLIRLSSRSYPFHEWPFSFIRKQLQPRILPNVLVFISKQEVKQEDIIVISYDDNSLVAGMCILKNSILFDGINCSRPFFYDTVPISREHLKRYVLSTALCLFHIIVTVIHFNKGSVVDLRKFEGCSVYLSKVTVAVLFQS